MSAATGLGGFIPGAIRGLAAVVGAGAAGAVTCAKAVKGMAMAATRPSVARIFMTLFYRRKPDW